MWTLPEIPGNALDETQQRQLTVLFRQILPAGPASPGAVDVGAVTYVDRLLSAPDDTYYELPAWKKLYPALLQALDDVAKASFGGPLADLDDASALALVTAWAGGTVTGLPAGVDAKASFEVLRVHCIEGALGDPRWGGNKDGAMWRWYQYLEEGGQTAWP